MLKYSLRTVQQTESSSVIKPNQFILRNEKIPTCSGTIESHKITIFWHKLGFLDYDLILCKLNSGP